MVIHDVIEALKDEAGGGARIVLSPNKDAVGYVTREGGRHVMVKVTVDKDRLFIERQEKWGGRRVRACRVSVRVHTIDPQPDQGPSVRYLGGRMLGGRAAQPSGQALWSPGRDEP